MKIQARIFQMDVLTVELERGTKTLQFDESCEAIHQSFDCGCVLKTGYANLQLSVNPNGKITIWNYWLKEQR